MFGCVISVSISEDNNTVNDQLPELEPQEKTPTTLNNYIIQVTFLLCL